MVSSETKQRSSMAGKAFGAIITLTTLPLPTRMTSTMVPVFCDGANVNVQERCGLYAVFSFNAMLDATPTTDMCVFSARLEESADL